MANVRFIDHSGEVLAQMRGNVEAALDAMGLEAVGMIRTQMQGGYGKPIWRTGDLQRDVNYAVENSGKNTVDVGNSLEYAPFVHEGTYKMAGRPYIADALNNGAGKLQEIAETYLKLGF